MKRSEEKLSEECRGLKIREEGSFERETLAEPSGQRQSSAAQCEKSLTPLDLTKSEKQLCEWGGGGEYFTLGRSGKKGLEK